MQMTNTRLHSKPNCYMRFVFHVTSFKQEFVKIYKKKNSKHITYKDYRWPQTLRFSFKLFISLKIPLKAGLYPKNDGFKEMGRVMGQNW